MTFSKTRRFLAGAVCPRCAKLDKIVVYNLEGKDYRECIDCGYKGEMHFTPAVKELDTRVNQTEASQEEETQVLKFPDKNSE